MTSFEHVFFAEWSDENTHYIRCNMYIDRIDKTGGYLYYIKSLDDFYDNKTGFKYFYCYIIYYIRIRVSFWK